MSRWSESRQLLRNFLVTSWRLPRNICYGEVTGKLVPVEFELSLHSWLHIHATIFHRRFIRLRLRIVRWVDETAWSTRETNEPWNSRHYRATGRSRPADPMLMDDRTFTGANTGRVVAVQRRLLSYDQTRRRLDILITRLSRFIGHDKKLTYRLLYYHQHHFYLFVRQFHENTTADNT